MRSGLTILKVNVGNYNKGNNTIYKSKKIFASYLINKGSVNIKIERY